MVWERLDEVFGSVLLTGIALYAMYSGLDSGIPEMCITGVIALLVTKAVRSRSEPLEESK